MNDFQPAMPPSPDVPELSWNYVLSRSYKLYAENFWIYFRIALIPALLAYLFNYVEHPINRYLAHIAIKFSPKVLIAYFFVDGWAMGLVYWITSMFFFAAIAATLHQDTESDQMAIADSFSLPRKRLGAVLKIALLTWTFFYIGRAISVFATMNLLDFFHLGRKFWPVTAGISLMVVLVCALLSRFGLAIPELMANLNISAAQAMRKSLKLTEGWEIFFTMFLIKSALVGYFAYWITNYALNWSWDHWALSGAAYPWVARTIYVCLAASLESPLFIAFSVLHEKVNEELNMEPEKAMSAPMA